MGLYFLDYGAGNVRSLANSLKKLGYDFEWVTCPADFHKATVRAPIPLPPSRSRRNALARAPAPR